MTGGQSPQGFKRGKRGRMRRNPETTAQVEDVMMGELESFHERLDRIGRSDLWAWLFGGLFQVALGAGVGTAIAEDGVKTTAFVCFGFALVGLLAYIGVRDTESDSIKAIKDDYKKRVLDTLEYEEAEEVPSSEVVSPPPPPPSPSGKSDEWVFNDPQDRAP